jgi:hypothetical protein
MKRNEDENRKQWLVCGYYKDESFLATFVWFEATDDPLPSQK